MMTCAALVMLWRENHFCKKSGMEKKKRQMLTESLEEMGNGCRGVWYTLKSVRWSVGHMLMRVGGLLVRMTDVQAGQQFLSYPAILCTRLFRRKCTLEKASNGTIPGWHLKDSNLMHTTFSEGFFTVFLYSGKASFSSPFLENNCRKKEGREQGARGKIVWILLLQWIVLVTVSTLHENTR